MLPATKSPWLNMCISKAAFQQSVKSATSGTVVLLHTCRGFNNVVQKQMPCSHQMRDRGARCHIAVCCSLFQSRLEMTGVWLDSCYAHHPCLAMTLLAIMVTVVKMLVWGLQAHSAVAVHHKFCPLAAAKVAADNFWLLAMYHWHTATGLPGHFFWDSVAGSPRLLPEAAVRQWRLYSGIWGSWWSCYPTAFARVYQPTIASLVLLVIWQLQDATSPHCMNCCRMIACIHDISSHSSSMYPQQQIWQRWPFLGSVNMM